MLIFLTESQDRKSLNWRWRGPFRVELGRIRWYPCRQSLLTEWSIVGTLARPDCLNVLRVPAIANDAALGLG